MASQALAAVLNKALEENPEYRQAASQIVGLTAAGLAGKDVEQAAWVSLMADQYNRQLHPDEIPLLKKQSESLAREAGISPQEAEKRLAQALVYYTDKDWNGVVTREGSAPEALTTQHLGMALSSRADTFAAPSSSDIPSTEERRYTAAETSQLITQYRDTHAAEYANPSINSVNVQGRYVGDFGFEYANFYRNNLGVPVDGSAMFSEGAVGAAQGAGTAFSDAGRAAWSLLSSPVQGSEQIVNGLMSLSKHPGDAMMDSVEASQTKQAMAYIYNLQGNYAASAAITTQSDVEFALSMIPANRASTLAELSSLGRQIDDLSLSGLASGETKAVGNRGAAANDDFFAANPVDEAAGLEGKGKALSEGSTGEQPALPSYYREDSTAGAMLAKTAGLPEGYRRVFNLRTDNVEVVSPEGVLYFDTPDGGLKPKAGDNLAQLVKAEGEIGAKEVGTSLTPVFKDTDTGLNAVNPIASNNRGRIQELGMDPDKGKLALHEGQAAVQLENTFGSTLERVAPILGQKNPDFVFTDGPYSGKTVDFMWTGSSRSSKINKFFSNNAVQNQRQLIDHFNKADIVPVDYRNLTPGNQEMVNGWIKLLPQEQQNKILILR
ncbi:hypothetical protein [Pseudomonas viridiflava]